MASYVLRRKLFFNVSGFTAGLKSSATNLVNKASYVGNNIFYNTGSILQPAVQKVGNGLANTVGKVGTSMQNHSIPGGGMISSMQKPIQKATTSAAKSAGKFSLSDTLYKESLVADQPGFGDVFFSEREK